MYPSERDPAKLETPMKDAPKPTLRDLSDPEYRGRGMFPGGSWYYDESAPWTKEDAEKFAASLLNRVSPDAEVSPYGRDVSRDALQVDERVTVWQRLPSWLRFGH